MTPGLRRGWHRLIAPLRRRHGDADLQEELESHIQMLADDLVASGVQPGEARRRARARLGSVALTRDEYRDQRALPFLLGAAMDFRFVVRGLRRNPGFAAVAILSLVLGIGANTAIFSIVNGVLLQPLGYAEPDRLFAARELSPPVGLGAVNPTHPIEWAAQCPSLEEVALMNAQHAQITGAGEPLSVAALRVSANLFSLLGVAPIAGRAFHADADVAAADAVVMISESLWRSRFSADPALVGKTIRVDGREREVVGILPAWFRPPYSASATRFDVMVPLVLAPEERTRLMGNFNYAAVVRLRRGVSVERALAEINAVEAQIPKRAGSSREIRAALIPVHELMTNSARPGLAMLAAAVGSVLLIVCVNLANLLLARITSRTREAAIRAALGAGRARLVSQILMESLLLSVAGGALGIVLARWLLEAFVATTTLNIPRLDQVRLDGGAVAFALALAIATAFLFGLLPAWRFTQADPQDALREGGRGATDARGSLQLREWLIGVEVGLSAALLILAGLLTTSLTRLLHVDKGFAADNVLTVDVRLAGGAYDDPVNQEKFYDRVLPQIRVLPGVEAAAIVTNLPTRGESWNDPIYLEGGTHYTVNNRYASPDYFRAMAIAVRNGRAFDETDRGRGVAVLSEKAASILWPGDANPIGRRFFGEDDKIKTLVGIVADVRAALPRDAPATAYYPYWQRVPDSATLVVRATGTPESIGAGVRAVLRREHPELPIPAMQTMDDVMGRSLAQRRFQARLMTMFAASALLIACIGIYGVVSFSVARRRNEISVRIALGAQPARVFALIIRQGLLPIVAGLAAGIAAAIYAARLVRSLLFDVQPYDVATVAYVAATLLLVGVLACWIPARRAARIDAVAALRFD